MAIKHLDLTLDGTVQRLTSDHIPVTQVRLESETGNADIQVGGSGLSSTSYGFTVTAGPAASKDIGPFSGNCPVNLGDIRVLGTDADILHVMYVTA